MDEAVDLDRLPLVFGAQLLQFTQIDDNILVFRVLIALDDLAALEISADRTHDLLLDATVALVAELVEPDLTAGIGSGIGLDGN